MYFSAYHWKPIIHGYTAYPPLLSRRAAARWPRSSRPRRRCRPSRASASTPSSCITAGRWAWTSRGGCATRATAIRPRSARLLRAGRARPLRPPSRRRGRRAASSGSRRASTAPPRACSESTADEVYRLASRAARDRRAVSRRAAASAIRAGATARRLGDPAPGARTATCPRRGGSRGSCWATSSSRSRSTGRGRSRASCCRSAATARSRRASAWPAASRRGGWVELARFDDAHVAAAPGPPARGSAARRARASTSAARDAGRGQPAGRRGGDELRGLVAPGGGGVGSR